MRNAQMAGEAETDKCLHCTLKSTIIKTERARRLLVLRESNIPVVDVNINALGGFLNSAY